MTCSRWRCLATALSPPSGPSARFFSSSSSSHRSDGNSSGSPWPQLKRKTSAVGQEPYTFHQFSVGQLAPKRRAVKELAPSAQDAAATTDATTTDAHESSQPAISRPDPSRLMLIVRGLSTNLKASDFHRLIPSDLSSWNVLKHVQQKRCPKTLEPLGIYYITFTSAVALSVYRDKLLRLHSLNKHKLRSADEWLEDKWELSVPSHLRAGSDDLAEEADSFTLAPGSLDLIAPERKRAGVPGNWWAKRLGSRVQQFGLGVSPPAVLLHVQPPTLSAQDLARLIEQDGRSRGCSWNVYEPLPLDEQVKSIASPESENGQFVDFQSHNELRQDPEQASDGQVAPASVEAEAEHDSSNSLPTDEGDVFDGSYKPRPLINYDTRERCKSRFVVVCADESEAHRFHRHWNQRTCASARHHEAEHNLVHASRINW